MAEHISPGRSPGRLEPADLRFTEGLYLRADVARLLGLPPATLTNWVRGYRYRTGDRDVVATPLLLSPSDDRWLSFANLVEAHALAAFRACGVSMQRIRPAVAYLRQQLGVEHPLACRQLQTDGAELFFRFMKQEGNNELMGLLNASRDGQIVFEGIVEEYLLQLDWAADGFAEKFWPAGRQDGIVIDPGRGFGQPIIERAGVRVENIAARLEAGEEPNSVAQDFELSGDEIAAVTRFSARLVRRAA